MGPGEEVPRPPLDLVPASLSAARSGRNALELYLARYDDQGGEPTVSVGGAHQPPPRVVFPAPSELDTQLALPSSRAPLDRVDGNARRAPPEPPARPAIKPEALRRLDERLCAGLRVASSSALTPSTRPRHLPGGRIRKPLLPWVRSAPSSELLHLACGALGQEALGSVAERLLMTAESLLEEELSAWPAARVSSGAAAMKVERSAAMDAELGGGARVVVAEDADELQGIHELRMPQKALLDQLLAGLESTSVQASPSVAKALCKLLPLATCCEAAHVRALLAHFSPFTDFDAYDTGKHGEPRYSFMLECLVTVVSVTSPAALADTVKAACVEHRVVSRAAAYLVTHLPSEKESNQGKLWEAALARPALPFVLQLLGALARGHVAVQQLLHHVYCWRRFHHCGWR